MQSKNEFMGLLKNRINKLVLTPEQALDSNSAASSGEFNQKEIKELLTANDYFLIGQLYLPFIHV
jgi:hypothetical protein